MGCDGKSPLVGGPFLYCFSIAGPHSRVHAVERSGAEQVRSGAEQERTKRTKRSGAERSGVERSGPERTGADRSGPEQSGADRGAERSGAEWSGVERSGAEREAAWMERSQAELCSVSTLFPSQPTHINNFSFDPLQGFLPPFFLISFFFFL